MSNKFINAVQYMQMPMIPKAVINSLANFADEDGRAFPSIPTLAACICCSIRSVGNGLEWLREQNLITQITGKGGNNIYYLYPENFTGEYKYPANFKASPLHHMQPCTKFTPAPHADTPAPHAAHPCTTFIEPLHDMPANHHINHHITTNESPDIYAPEIEQNLHQEIESVTTEKLIEPKPKPKAKPKAKNTSIPENFSISENVQAWANEKGFTNLEDHLEYFIDKAIAKNYQYADWDRAFMGAIRDDWAKVRQAKTIAQYQKPVVKNRLNDNSFLDSIINGSQPSERDITPKKLNEYLEYGHA